MKRWQLYLHLLGALLAPACLAQIPDSVKLTAVFGTGAENRFRYPVWFGEIPGQKDVYAVVEQGNLSSADKARIWVLEPDAGKYVRKEFLAMDVRKDGEECGLLGMAFHPAFAQNRRYFIYYTAPVSGEALSVLEERTADATFRKDSGNPGKRLITFTRKATNHNGGTLAFGKDGFLYAGFGEDAQFDPSQDLKSFKGKLIRIDVDNPGGGLPYGIPADNPLVANTDPLVLKEIWAYGLRNPWKWSFDTQTGELWLADVGESTQEEISLVKKGENHGWPVMEGRVCRPPATSCQTDGKVLPVKSFNRDSSTCIIGGHIFRGNSKSPFFGHYLFADYQLRRLYVMTLDKGAPTGVKRLAATPDYLSSVGMDAQGRLYGVGHYSGTIYLLDNPLLMPGEPVGTRAGRGGDRLSINPLVATRAGLMVHSSLLPNLLELELYSLDGLRMGGWRGQGAAIDLRSRRPGLALVKFRTTRGSQVRMMRLD